MAKDKILTIIELKLADIEMRSNRFYKIELIGAIKTAIANKFD